MSNNDYKPEPRDRSVSQGINQRVEIIGEGEPLGKYVSYGAMNTFVVPVHRIVSMLKDTPAPQGEKPAR